MTKTPFVLGVTHCGDCPMLHTDNRNGEWCGVDGNVPLNLNRNIYGDKLPGDGCSP